MVKPSNIEKLTAFIGYLLYGLNLLLVNSSVLPETHILAKTPNCLYLSSSYNGLLLGINRSPWVNILLFFFVTLVADGQDLSYLFAPTLQKTI